MSFKFDKVIENGVHIGVKDIHPENILAHLQDILLIDVRRPDEFTGELGHISGSQLLVLDDLPEKIQDLPRDQTIVFICRSGNRSGQASLIAMENGFEHTYNMLGGMLLWNDCNYKVEK